MHKICARWHKPKSRPSRKRILAEQRSAKRWNKSTSDDAPVPEPAVSNQPTASQKKMDFFTTEIENAKSSEPMYALVHRSVWKDLLKNVSCDFCKSEITVSTTSVYGYSSNLELKCSSCDKVFGSSFSSPRLPNQKRFEVNKDVVEGFLSIGKGHAAMEKFSMALGIPTMDRKTFDTYVHQLFDEGKGVEGKVLEIARETVRKHHIAADSSLPDDSSEPINIGVSFDGSWHKRGHSSLYGIGCVIDIVTGLVVDYIILSKYCPECVRTLTDFGEKSPEFAFWYQGHKDVCENNFEGSSGAMEVKAADILWKRSIEKCNMRYTVMLADGDSKSHTHLNKIKVYGDIQVIKEECVNHISKRLGTALRNKIKEWRAKGVCLGGKKKGNVTEGMILKLQNYYRRAIIDNKSDVNGMRSAIFASLYHCMSTDKKPLHSKCPQGERSWCFFNRALAFGQKTPKHNKMKMVLSEDVVSKILPVYQRLASEEILNRCTSGKTQNANESLHSLIWSYCPKDTFVTKKRIELAAMYAISQFNMGCAGSLAVGNSEIAMASMNIAQKRDSRRIKQSILRSTSEYKTRNVIKKNKKKSKNIKTVQTEGVLYSPGLF